MSDIAVLVIDVQVGLVDVASNGTSIVNRIVNVVNMARSASVPVIFIQHDDDGGNLQPSSPGWHLHPLLKPSVDEIVIRKRASDSFYRTPLLNVLRSKRIGRVVVIGFCTEMCVDTTCRQATSLGFNVTLVTDAHSTTSNNILTAEQIIAHHNMSLSDFGNDEHCIVTTSSSDINFA